MYLKLLLLLLLFSYAESRIHTLKVTNDPRFVWSIEPFGFYEGGKISITVRDVSATPINAGHVMGFVIFPTMSIADINANVKVLAETQLCALDAAPPGARALNMSDRKLWTYFHENDVIEGGGMFDLLFTHCLPVNSGNTMSADSIMNGGPLSLRRNLASTEPVTVSFTLEVIFVNPGENYLSAGDIPLPGLFGFMTVAFAGTAVFWVWWLRKNQADVHRVHHLMTLLICVKALQLMFEALMYHYIAVTGHNSAWNAMFYIFTILKTCIMALVAILVATGWSILRPFLTQREKTVLACALWLQIIANTAIIVTDEIAPGSLTYLEFSYLFYIADLLAAVAVVVPLHWSVKQLHQTYASGAGADTSAKTQETLDRLVAMRAFYTTTLVYVYVTRLLLWLLSQGVSYRYTWLPPFLEEVVCLAYYVWTGYKFKPSLENAYLRVSQDDDEDNSVQDVARATGAAAGTIEGSSSAVQTVESRRAQAVAAVSSVMDLQTDKASSTAAVQPSKAIKAAVIGEEHDDDDDDFDLDDLDDEEENETTKVKGRQTSASDKGVIKMIRKG
jgi:G protein-coupled receptor 107